MTGARHTTPDSGSTVSEQPVLSASGLEVGYNRRAFVKNVDLEIRPGEKVALLGANGAGKTTILLALAGMMAPLAGAVRWQGNTISSPLYKRARNGLGFVPAERAIFSKMTVAENIRVGRCEVSDVLEHFPELEKRLKVSAGSMSGGEQQMLSLGRALARRPRALLVDELSLGLAPIVIARLYQAIDKAALDGTAILFVEQHLTKALELADRAYVLSRGQIAISDTADVVAGRTAEIEDSYLGSNEPADVTGYPLS